MSISANSEPSLLSRDFLQLGPRGPLSPAAMSLQLGEFLEGFTIPDATGFEDWLSAERIQWSGRGVAVLSAWSAALAGIAAAVARAVDDPDPEVRKLAVALLVAVGPEGAAADGRKTRYAPPAATRNMDETRMRGRIFIIDNVRIFAD